MIYHRDVNSDEEFVKISTTIAKEFNVVFIAQSRGKKLCITPKGGMLYILNNIYIYIYIYS